MKLSNSFGINKQVRSFNRIVSERPSAMHEGPLSSVKTFEICEFPEEPKKSEHSLCDFYGGKALELYNNREFFSAIHQYKRGLAYDPRHFESLVNLGACYYKLQLLDEAIIVFTKIIKMNPHSPIGYLNKALSELQLQEYNRCIVTVDHAVNILKDPPEELFKIRTFVMYQSGKITNILDGIKSKNGFELKKYRNSTRKVLASPLQECSFKRPKSSSLQAHRTLYLYPDSKKSFININEVNLHSPGKKKQKKNSNFSYNSSPRGKAKSPIYLNKFPFKSNRNSFKTEPVRSEPIKAKKVIEPPPCFKPGLIQIDYLERFHGSFEEKDTSGDFNENLQMLQKYVENDLERVEELKEANDDKNYDFITECEIKMLVEEFRKAKRSMEKIDKIGLKLSFLQKFPQVMRESLYRCAEIETFSSGEVVFNEGDSGDSMFVIIKGSVVISKCLEAVKKYPIVISSLYDGRQFGDISVLSTISEETTRKGTCTVTEPSTMFKIPKVEYKNLLFQYLKPELEAKANFLLKVRLFQDIELSSLYSLASNIEIRKLSLGQTILKKGQFPTGLYIVKKGHVEVVTEGLIEKKKKPSIYANVKIREKSPRPFYTGNTSPKSPERNKSVDTNSIINISVFEDSEGLVKDKILNFTLHSTEYFGGTALLDGEVYSGALIKLAPSKFSFLAKSSEVEVVIITKDLLSFLQAKAENQVKVLLSKSFHIDCPSDIDPVEMDELFNKWQKYKLDIVEDIRRKRYVEKNKLNFPYVR